MAARKSTGPSRRQAVLALGAGIIGGTIDLGAGKQSTAPKATTPPKTTTGAKTSTTAKTGGHKAPRLDDDKECGNKPTREGYVNVNEKLQLQLATCCRYGNDVLKNGYPNTATGTKAALKTFMALLAAEEAKDGFLDYCFIQFDIKKEQIDQVRNTVAGILKG